MVRIEINYILGIDMGASRYGPVLETLLPYFGVYIPFEIDFGQDLAGGLYGTCTERMIKRNGVAKSLRNVCRTERMQNTQSDAHLRECCQECVGTYESEMTNRKVKGMASMNV